MSKLEYPGLINDWGKFNFLGKRLFDFINRKINISTGGYTGDGIANRLIRIDIIPKVIIIFPVLDFLPTIWTENFPPNFSKTLDGVTVVDGIVGITGTKDAFIISSSVNTIGNLYSFVVFGE